MGQLLRVVVDTQFHKYRYFQHIEIMLKSCIFKKIIEMSVDSLETQG